jgi:uncharacterized repeat protein (TIGR01451 family)
MARQRMKNNMKKLIVGLFAFVLLLVGQSVFAAPLSYVTWNTSPDDCPDINIKNGNVGGGNPCWTGVNITAVPGNNIDVKVYYHNTGDMTATNTRIKVIPSPSVGQSDTVHSFIGKILSNQANHTSNGDVTVTISSSQSLSFVSTTWWTKPDPDENYLEATPLLSGQDGSEVLESNGLYIGDIAPGWGTQGAVTVRFHVNNVAPPTCEINNFEANPDTVPPGQLSELSWNTTNCAYSKIFVNGNQIGGTHYGSSGSYNVWPNDTTEYTLKAYKSNGTVGDTQTTTVTVNAPPENCSIDYFKANPTHIVLGGSSTLSWDTTNCETTKLSVGTGLKSLGVYGSSGSKTVSPIMTTTYTLKAYSANGTLGETKTAKVTITTTTPECSIIDFDATPNHIDEGDSSTLDWTVSNCAYTKLFKNNSPIGGPYYGTTGSKSVSPEDTTTYTLKAYKQNGTVGAMATAIVNVNTTITPTCSITDFTASPTTIDPGESSILEWDTTGCQTTKLFIGYTQIGQYGASGSKTVSPEHQTTYTLKAYIGQVEKASSSVTVSISTQDCQIAFFYAVPTTITNGESSVLNWNTSDCYNTKLFIGYTQIGTFEPSDALTVWPDHLTTYTLKAYNLNGTVGDTAQATIEVEALPACSISNFTASPTSIDEGDSSMLTWNTSGCESVVISNLDYGVPVSGSQTVWPEDTTTYVLTATGQGGDVHTRSVTVYVDTNNSNCSISSFYAVPSSIEEGESSKLYWTTNGCTNVNIEGIGQVSTNGSRTVWPTYTRTYILNAEDNNGNGVSGQTTIYVDEENNNNCEINNFDASDTSIEDGDEVTLEWNTSNCDYVKITDLGNVPDDGEEDVSPDEDTTYVLTAYDFDGSHQTESIRIYVDEDGNNNGDECTVDSFTASDTYIDRGDEVTLRWRTTDCDDVSITNVGDVSDDGSEDVSPYQTTTYILRAYGDGSDSKSIRINVNNYNDDQNYNTNVVTTVATNISQTGAQLNGLITGSNFSGGSTYFEYWTSVNMGMRTISRATNGNNTFSEYVTNLNSGTVYYFRAVSEGSYGISYGSIEIFQTLRYQNNNTQIIRQVIQGPTIAGSESPIMLQIENRYQTISVGDTVEYTVFYKNISSSRLTNPMVQVFFPEGIEFVSSSRGTYSNGDKTLSVPIEDLRPDDEGTIYIEAVVESLDRNMAQIVTTAVLIYTNPNGAQENAMAYVLNSPRGNVLGASAFFGKIFGMGLIGWLLLIIIILLLVLIARSYYGRRNLLVSPFHAEKNHL